MEEQNAEPRHIDRLNDRLAGAMAWLLLSMVVVTFVVVCLRYIFNVGWVWLQEIVMYAHAAVFLLSCASVHRRDGHVRIDVFYGGFSALRRAKVNAIGAFTLLVPTCAVILFVSIPYVLDSWRVFEGSKDGGGLEGVFILKTLIPVFAVLLMLQGLRMGLADLKRWRGRSDA